MDVKILLETPPWEWPEEAAKLILRTLTDQRAGASDRLIAAQLAGELVVMNNAMADRLMAILRDTGEPEELRARAAISFGPVLEQGDIDEFDDPDDVPITEGKFHSIQDLLHKLYNDPGTPKYLRRRILEASVRAAEDWHPAAIAAAYTCGDPEWLLTAVFAMGYIPGFESQILESLKSSDPEIHRYAVEAAGNWEIDEAWAHVAALATNAGTPKPLRLAAIEAVGGIRPAEAEKTLAKLLDSRDKDIAEVAEETISMAGAASFPDDDEDKEGDDWIN